MILPTWLIAAYHATTYKVFAADGEIQLRIGEANSALRNQHQRHDVTSSVFVTAFNPLGESLSDLENTLAMSRLSSLVMRRGLTAYPGEGCGDDPLWSPEPSLLILGIDLRRARALCRLFRQNAVVYSAADGVPTLVLHDHASAGS